MLMVSIEQMAKRLEELVEHAAAGNPFFVTDAGKPVASVTRLDENGGEES